MAHGRSNAAGGYSGQQSYSQTKTTNDDGSETTITQPYIKPTTYTQSSKNKLHDMAADSETNLATNGNWAGFFGGNSPMGVKAGFAPNSPAIANAAGMSQQTQPATQTPAVAPAATTPPASSGFSFGAGMQSVPPAVALTPMTAADHINAAVAKGQAAITAMGIPAQARTFGSASSPTVSSISGAPQSGDTIVSKYGTGSVTGASPSNASSRLQKLAAPDYSDIGIYG